MADYMKKIFFTTALVVLAFPMANYAQTENAVSSQGEITLEAPQASVPSEPTPPDTTAVSEEKKVETTSEGVTKESNVAGEGVGTEPPQESLEDTWDLPWYTYLGKIVPYSETELPEKIRKASEEDDAETQFVLGYMYHMGQGVPMPDDFIAQKWYSKAAKSNHPKAMLALGQFYMNYGDSNLATKWFSRAADAGESYGNYKLGEIYEYGFGTTLPNPDKSFKHYSTASEAGIEMAMLKVGQFYQWGYGVEADIEKAIAQYQKISLSTKSKKKKLEMDFMISEVYILVAEQKEPAEKLQWLLKSADLENLRAMVMTADMYYEESSGITQNIPEAIKWYEKAAAKGDVYSMVRLGYIFSQGTLEADPDFCKAKEYYNKAAERGNDDAMYNLGNFYYNGYCADHKDYDEARKWWGRMKKRR